MKVLCFFLLFLSCFSLISEDIDLYIKGLELIIEGEEKEAVLVFEQLIQEYPDSPYVLKAEVYINEYKNSFDRSGVVDFYIGNLITATYVSMSLPGVLGIEDNLIITGSTGILGVSAGIYSAWLMTRNRDMSFSQAHFTDMAELISITNYQYLYLSVLPDSFIESDIGDRVNAAGTITTALLSRGLSYNWATDNSVYSGMSSFILNNYAWFNLYYWMTVIGILESGNDRLNTSLALALGDLTVYGSYSYWMKSPWSSLRSGLVTVGGLGGLALGLFTNMIIDSATGDFSSQRFAGVFLGFSIAGQAVAVKLTEGIKPQEIKDSAFLLIPQVKNNSFGLRAVFQF